MKRIVYSIEGNIGSGKTTLLHLFKIKNPQIFISPEPLHDWQKVASFNLLQTYYDQPNRWAYTFQNYALLTRMRQLNSLSSQNHGQNTYLFSQRSVIADKQIFAKLLFKEGKMNEMEYQLYLKVFDQLSQLYMVQPIHKPIYLRTNPQICKKRMLRRARDEQKNVDLSFLQDIHQLHQKWLGKGFIIEGSNEFQQDQVQSQRMIKQMQEWILNDK